MLDIIIIGAGIAGLSLGKELSSKYKILILEKNSQITKKTWLTKKSILEDNNLLKYNSINFNKYFIKSVNITTKKLVENDFCGVKEDELVNHYINEIKKQGNNISFKDEYLKHQKNNDYLTVVTTKKTYTCKLLIDCSGCEQVSQKKRKKQFYYNVYGQVFNSINTKDQVNLLSVYKKETPVPYFEVVPISKTEVVSYTFFISKKIVTDFKILKNKNKENLEDDANEHKVDINKPLCEVKGNIPLTINYNNSKDNLFLFGDSSSITPPFSGVGFSKILEKSSEVAKHLDKCLSNNSLLKKNLKYKYTYEEKLSNTAQEIIRNLLYNINYKGFENILYLLKKFPDELINNIFMNNITKKEFKNIIKFCISSENKKIFIKILNQGIKLNNILEMICLLIKGIYYYKKIK